MDATPFGYGKRLRLPEPLRPELRIPLGRLANGESFRREVRAARQLVTVGDYCTAEALAASARPRVAVVDLRIQREDDSRVKKTPLFEGAKVLKVRNPAGTLAPEVWGVLEDAYSAEGPVVIQVEGEEDLLALPAIVLAPSGAVVAYGLPGRGAVLVDVTGEARGRAATFLSQMEVVDGS